MKLSTNPSDKVKFGLTLKLFLLVLVVCGLMIGVNMLHVTLAANKIATSTIEKSFRQLRKILDTRFNSRFSNIEEMTRNLAVDVMIQPLIYEQEQETLQDRCNELKQSLDFDILIFTDADGRVLASSDDVSTLEPQPSNSPLFQQALLRKTVRGIMRKGDELFQVVVQPIFDNVADDLVRGTVAVAYRFSEALTEEIKNLTGCEIAFYSFETEEGKGEPSQAIEFYNTFDKNDSQLREYFGSQKELWQKVYTENSSQEGLIQLLDGTYHVLLRPLTVDDGVPFGFVTALRSRTELLAPFRSMKQRAFLSGVILLVVASIVSYAIAHHISEPIIELVAVTHLIEDGNYPEPQSTSRSDEVGILSNAVYKIGQKLKENASLEEYLSLIAEEPGDMAEEPHEFQSVLSTTLHTENEILAKIVNKLKPGTIFAERYKIEKMLGMGSMGVVFRVKDIQLDEAIALKVILEDEEKTGNSLELFNKEIRLARKITHRNVLRTFDCGYSDGIYYITMEYVQGIDLWKMIDLKGPIDLRMGIVLSHQMCSAIAAAHNEGIIHRDLKPQNVIISRRGICKIMDFGIATYCSKFNANATNHSPSGDR